MLTTEEHERLRRSFRSEKVRVLFVGQSPPAQGTFFHLGTSNLYRYTREAFEIVYGARAGEDPSSFLHFFQDYGCYVDDLCLEPAEYLHDPERKERHRAGNQRRYVKGLVDISRSLRVVEDGDGERTARVKTGRV